MRRRTLVTATRERRRRNVTPTCLHVRLLAEVDDDSPAKVGVFIFHLRDQNKEPINEAFTRIIIVVSLCVCVCVTLYLDKPPGLQEGEAVFGFVDERLDLITQFGQLLSDFIVSEHTLFIRDLNFVVLLFILLHFCREKNQHYEKDDMKYSRC